MTTETPTLEPGAPPAPEPTPDPPPEPAGQGPEPAPPPKAHRLVRRPTDPRGVYMVLAGNPPGREAPPRYREIGWFRAHSPEQAKRQAATDARNGHEPELQEDIRGHGVLLRGVPASSWPTTKLTRYRQPEPKLELG